MDFAAEAIPIGIIRISDGRRAVSPTAVRDLAESMLAVGLIEPVVVRREGDGYVLVAGAHRLAAARLLGWREVSAHVVDASETEAALMEGEENLLRAPLSALEEDEALRRRAELIARLNSRPTLGIVGTVEDAVATVAAERGMTVQRARRGVRRARALAPEVKEALAGTDYADCRDVLDALAKQPEEKQRSYVDVLLSAPDVDSGRRAIADILLRRPALGRPAGRWQSRVLGVLQEVSDTGHVSRETREVARALYMERVAILQEREARYRAEGGTR